MVYINEIASVKHYKQMLAKEMFTVEDNSLCNHYGLKKEKPWKGFCELLVIQKNS